MASYANTFKYSVIAPPVGSTSALFYVNPIEIDWQIGKINNMINILDGEPVIQKPLRDNRIRKMIWRSWPINNSTITNQLSQIETDMLGKQYYFIDGSIGVFTNWIKCRGIDLQKTYRAEPGKIRYNEIIYTFIIIDTSWSSF